MEMDHLTSARAVEKALLANVVQIGFLGAYWHCARRTASAVRCRER